MARSASERSRTRTRGAMTLAWSPVWSRDGSHLIYASERSGQWQLIRDALDSQARPEVLLTKDHELEPGGISADGRSLVYVERAASGSAHRINAPETAMIFLRVQVCLVPHLPPASHRSVIPPRSLATAHALPSVLVSKRR